MPVDSDVPAPEVMEWPRDYLDRAFQLAFFIHRERTVALRIACEAVAATEVAVVAQDKRRYYLPAGRRSGAAARLPARRDKVSMARPLLLQRLVYSESEPFERAQEEAGVPLTDEDMIVRFIKHLVRITVRRNTLYVALGLGRLLYRYSTGETARIYDLVTQDPDRLPEEHYFRSRKQQLFREIGKRFGEAVRAVRGPRGEKVLEPRRDSARLTPLVSTALGMFTPWHTPCVVPSVFDPMAQELMELRYRGSDADAEHPVEVRRMHALLHPECFCRLIRALGLERPDRRLAVPRFHMEKEEDPEVGPPGDRAALPELRPEERDAMMAELRTRATRRKSAAIGVLSISVDGEKACRIDLEGESRARIEVEAAAERIDVHSVKGEESVLLATLLLHHLEPHHSRTRSVILLEGGQEITFDVAPLSVGGEESVSGAVVEVGYRETRLLRVAMLWWRRVGELGRRPFAFLLKPPPRLVWALSIVTVFGLGWLLHQSLPGPTPEAPDPEAPSGRTETRIPPPFVGKTSGETLRGRPTRRSVRLAEVETIYVDPLGGGPFLRELRRLLIAEVAAGGRFRVSETRDSADAVLKLAPPESAAGQGEPAEGGPKLRLVNRGGDVLWQGAHRGTAREIARETLAALDAE